MMDRSRKEKPRFTVIGAGLGGALIATYLGRVGYEVEVYERRPDPRSGNVTGGRSINLAISARGIHALTELGLADQVMKMAIPMRGRMIHSPAGELSFQPYDKNPDRCINSISRVGLNVALIQAADACNNVRMHFEHKCIALNLDRPAVTLETHCSVHDSKSRDTAHAVTKLRRRVKEITVDSDIVLSADGAFSVVRSEMQRIDRFNVSQTYLEHGYKELSIPATSAGDFAMEPHALHIWPRRSFMMIALPNPDRTFTCTLFLAFEGPTSFATLQSDGDVGRFFERQFPDAVAMMPTLLENFRRNPTGSLATIRSGPWYYCDKVVLLGDAAHAIVPFYGQGMNCAFEDCTELNECIRRHAPDWERTFARYYEQRKRHADAIADLALHNFIEMRDHAGSRMFRLKKGLERTIHRIVPGYLPLYSMVSFSRIPYADAVRRARRQTRAVVAAALGLLVLLMVLGIALWPRSL